MHSRIVNAYALMLVALATGCSRTPAWTLPVITGSWDAVIVANNAALPFRFRGVMTMQTGLPFVAALGLFLFVTSAAHAQVTKENVQGITNFARVETTVACAGATTPSALTEVKRLGYKAVVNLRVATEAGADIDGEAAAAKAAGITFVHLPFNAQSPDPMLVERFLKVVTAPENQPAFIHCASGNRAAALWLIKRVEVDKWDVDRASTEAAALGLTSSALKTFALDQIKARAK
jgi:uncharacterized protein (TIGR01244 family)